MKKKIVFLLVILLIPICVFAKEDAGLYTKFDELFGNKHKIVVEGYKTLRNNYLYGYPSEPDAEGDPDGFTTFMSAYVNNLPEVKEFVEQYADEHVVISVYCRSYTNCGIRVDYDSDARGDGDFEPGEYPGDKFTHYDVEVSFDENPNNNAYENILDQFDNEFEFGPLYRDVYLHDLSFVNQLYTQNKGFDSFLDIRSFRNIPLVAKNFPEIKDFLIENPDTEMMNSGTSSMGGSIYEPNVDLIYGVDFTLFYKKTAYLNVTYRLHVVPVIYVGNDVQDDELMDAAIARIKKYINNDDVKIVMDDITPTFDDDILNSKYEGLYDYLYDVMDIELDYEPRIYSLKIGNSESPFGVFIIRTDEKNLKDLEVQSIEKETGIRFKSTDAIPIDSELIVEDVTTRLKKLNAAVLNAFDISIYSETNASFVTTVNGGIKIYIPVDDSFKPSGKKIAYFNDKGKVIEKYNIEVETVNGRKYATFVTKHLSLYGIVDEALLKDAENPNTADKILMFVAILILSVGILTAALIRKKKLEN